MKSRKQRILSPNKYSSADSIPLSFIPFFPKIRTAAVTMKPSTIAARPNPKSLDSTDVLLKFSHKPGVDLIRNCDLPPPQKVFTGARDGEESESESAAEKLELLKAVRLSQTRAREAERRAAKLREERDCISRAFQDEARLMFGYRQSLKLLEIRVSNLQNGKEYEDDDDDEDDGDGGGGGVKWAWALGICFGVVGVGFFLGLDSFLANQ